MLDLSRPITQSEFGALVGVSQQAISEFLKSAALQASTPAGELLIAYCARLRESAAGRGSESDGGEYIREKTRLARAQRIAQDLKNAVTRREYAPVNIITLVLAHACQGVAGKLDALPGALVKIAPELSDAGRDAIVAAIARARNDWVADMARLDVSEVDGVTVAEADEDESQLEASPDEE